VLGKEIEACERYITYLEKNFISREDEIERLKAECQSTLRELKKYQDHLELKEEALVIQDEHIIQLEDIVSKLKKRIHDLSMSKRKMDVDTEILNPIEEVLDRQQAISACLSEICLFLDRNAISVPKDIDDIFNASARSLDDIIRHASTLQTIGEDQLDQIEGLQVLLNNALKRANRLDQELNNMRAELLRIRQIHEGDYTYERNGHRHWQNIAQQQQARIGGLLIDNMGLRLLNRHKGIQIANQQAQIAEYRRNAHRLTVRYNNDMQVWQRRYDNNMQTQRRVTDHWRRRHAGCVRYAQSLRG
jgi:chromosome segregation ATPase